MRAFFIYSLVNVAVVRGTPILNVFPAQLCAVPYLIWQKLSVVHFSYNSPRRKAPEERIVWAKLCCLLIPFCVAFELYSHTPWALYTMVSLHFFLYWTQRFRLFLQLALTALLAFEHLLQSYMRRDLVLRTMTVIMTCLSAVVAAAGMVLRQLVDSYAYTDRLKHIPSGGIDEILLDTCV